MTELMSENTGIHMRSVRRGGLHAHYVLSILFAMKKKTSICIAILLVVLVHISYSSDGITYKTLEEVISEYRFIAIVEKGDPVYTRKEIDLAPFWRKLLTCIKKYRPFAYNIYHFNVVEILYADERVNIAEGTRIDVNPSHLHAEISRHKEEEVAILEGSSGILYESLESGINSSEHDKLIVF